MGRREKTKEKNIDDDHSGTHVNAKQIINPKFFLDSWQKAKK